MRSLSRDARLTLIVFGILIVLWGVVAVREARRAGLPPLSAFSDEPAGGRALALWLEEVGYDVRRPRQPAFGVPVDADVVLLLEPTVSVSEAELEQLEAWVGAGGTLIAAGESFAFLRYAAALELELRLIAGGEAAPAQTVTPLLDTWSAAGPLAIESSAYFEVGQPEAVTLVAGADRPVFVTFPRGTGRIVAGSTAVPFSNLKLREGAPLLLGMLEAFAPADATIWIDEWHHGIRATPQGVGPMLWLRQTAAGRAVLFLILLAAAMLLINGRRLGRPLSPAVERRRRSPLEFVDAMANLSRRAGHRQAVQEQYRRRLKRELSAPYHVDPTLSDAAFVREMAQIDERIDQEELAALLERLERPLSERDLVRAASDVHDLLNDARRGEHGRALGRR